MAVLPLRNMVYTFSIRNRSSPDAIQGYRSTALGITRPSTSSRRMRQMVRQVERRAAAVQNILRHQPRIRHRLADGLMARIPMLAHRPRGAFEIAAAAFPGVGAVDQEIGRAHV